MNKTERSSRLSPVGPIYPRWMIGGIVFLCVISLGSRWLMTERLPFMMDELVDTQLACQVARGVRIYAEMPWERTPLMTYLISAVTGPGRDSFRTAVLARKPMWVGTVLIFVLTYGIARRVYGPYTAAWSLLLLCAYTTFLDQSIQVRADLVSTVFSLPALWVLVGPRLHPVLLAVAGLSLGLAVLTTQKAVYFVAAFGVALTVRQVALSGLTAHALRTLALNALHSMAGFAMVVVPFLAWFHLSGRLGPFLEQCFFAAARIGLVADTYNYTWRYLLQTILRNPLLWTLAVVGVLSLFHEGLRDCRAASSLDTVADRPGAKIALSLWTLSLLALVVRHHVKFPYFFLTVAPTLALSASHPFDHGVRLLVLSGRKSNWRFAVIALLSACLLLLVPLLRHVAGMRVGLIEVQRSVMDRIDEITDPNDAVFDGIGVAVTRRKATPYSMTVRWWAEREGGAPYDILGHLQRSRPKVFVENYRMDRLSETERAFINSHFVPDWANVYVVGTSVIHETSEPTVKTVDLLAPAEYAVLAGDRSRIRIDGTIPGTTVFLTAGLHDVTIDGARQELFLKYAEAVRIPRPVAHEPFALFPSYSD